MNSINLGFDIGVNTDVGPSLLKSDLMQRNENKLSLFNGSLNLWAIGGAFLASLLADQLGRRKSFAVASVGFIIGVLCMASAQSFTVLMLGRVVVGLGCGFGFAVDPVYISEISPPHARGRLVTWSEIGTNIGILLGGCLHSEYIRAIVRFAHSQAAYPFAAAHFGKDSLLLLRRAASCEVVHE